MKLSILTLACALSFVPMAGAMADETMTTTEIDQNTIPVVQPAPSTTIIERAEPNPVIVPAPAPVVVERRHHHLINLPFVHLF